MAKVFLDKGGHYSCIQISHVKAIHIHKLNSMWYEPEPDVAKDQSVTDIEYNDGRITRNGLEILPRQFADLVSEWEKWNEL